MERFRTSLMLSVVVGLGVVSAGVGETQVARPTGGTVTALAVDDSGALYAGTLDCGVFKSVDGRARWRAVNSGLPVVSKLGGPRLRESVDMLAIDPQVPNTIYAATDGSGIFRSASGGLRWQPANAGLRSYYTNAVVVDPARPATLYAAVNSYGVFKSTNAGKTWERARNGLPADASGLSLAIAARKPAHVYLATFDGVHKSTNRGRRWRRASAGLEIGRTIDGKFAYTTVVTLAADPTRAGTIYAGTEIGVFKSVDGGHRWRARRTGLPEGYLVNALAIDATAPQTLYAGVANDVLKSTDGGLSWRKMVTGLGSGHRNPGYVGALAIDPHDSMTIYVGLDRAGVYRSTDGGGAWRPMSDGLTATDGTC